MSLSQQQKSYIIICSTKYDRRWYAMQSKFYSKYQNFGFAVARARKLRKMTQEQLADKMNVSYETISRIENANTGFTGDMLFEISEALDISVEEIFKYAQI